MLSKMDLSLQIHAKSAQLKNESKSRLFSAPADAQESANVRSSHQRCSVRKGLQL